jgi:hypothetical protein
MRNLSAFGVRRDNSRVFHGGARSSVDALDSPNPHEERTMVNKSEPVRLKLTPEQQEEIRRATGKNAEFLELSVQELEERIAPMTAAGFKPVL